MKKTIFDFGARRIPLTVFVELNRTHPGAFREGRKSRILLFSQIQSKRKGENKCQ